MHKDPLLRLGLALSLLFFFLSLYAMVVSAKAWGADIVESAQIRTWLSLVATLFFFAVSFRLAGDWYSGKLKLYQQLFLRANDAITVIGQDGTYLMQNQAHRTLLGFNDQELPQVTPCYRAGNDLLNTVESLKELKQFSGEFRVAQHDGNEVDVRLSCFTISNELDDPLYFVEIKRDITEFKKMEAQIRQERERLATLSSLDQLTGIFNRRKFHELAERELQRAKRYQESLTVVLFDIDHFKAVNDTFGHNQGDTVLKRVATTAANRVRATDVFCRWGGEEFLLLLPQTTIQQATMLAESLRKALALCQEPPEITASFGIANWHEAETLEHLVARADSALYQAKANGRNRIEIA